MFARKPKREGKSQVRMNLWRKTKMKKMEWTTPMISKMRVKMLGYLARGAEVKFLTIELEELTKKL